MPLKVVFVGIDRHRSPDVPELGDATALWALFTDSVPGIAARLLVDDRATLVDVRDAVVGTLDAADADDIVVLSFAGHASPDGSLVVFDTDPADLAGTALSMTVLAEAFPPRPGRPLHPGLLLQRSCSCPRAGDDGTAAQRVRADRHLRRGPDPFRGPRAGLPRASNEAADLRFRR